jgi:hypothetical protein
MSFNGDEGQFITLEEAVEWTRNYRDANPTGVKGHFYGKEKLMDILNQSGAMGIRIYQAIDNSGAECLVLVAADAEEGDLYDGLLLERGFPCPPICKISPLNK